MSTTTLGIGWRRTAVGEVRFAVGTAGALVALGFREQWEALVRRLERRFGPVALVPTSHAAHVGASIDRYLAGDLSALDVIATDPGGTDFQRRVWTALRAIPAGSTRSYAAVARAVGAPRAVRAVGAANATNPVSIVIPCHRVIGHDGELRGYAGGVDCKRWLLSHESGDVSHASCGSADAHAVASG